MRHAEKPDDPLESSLTDAGRERAQRLAKYIPETFGKPDFLFASADSKYSRRPRKTLMPLSKACGIAIDDSFADQDYPALAHEIRNTPRYDGKRIVICWHHGNIPPLAHALKAKPRDYPDPWPSGSYQWYADHGGEPHGTRAGPNYPALRPDLTSCKAPRQCARTVLTRG
jgi:broad specificity phosphatase PhoE